jgi:hypothetical protein
VFKGQSWGLTRNIVVKACKGGVKLQQRNANRELAVVQLAKGCPFTRGVCVSTVGRENDVSVGFIRPELERTGYAEPY